MNLKKKLKKNGFRANVSLIDFLNICREKGLDPGFIFKKSKSKTCKKQHQIRKCG
jgi:hypothetical protein